MRQSSVRGCRFTFVFVDLFIKLLWMFAGSRLLLPDLRTLLQWLFFIGESNIMDIEELKEWLEVKKHLKNILLIHLFLTNTQIFTLQDVNWWSGVVWITCVLSWCFYQLFGLSFWRHFSEVTLNFPKSVLMKKQTHLYFLLFGVNYSFKD